MSLKTQQLYALVFLTRYVDLLFTNPLRSPLTTYNTVMKVLFITSSLYIVHQMRTRYVHTYSAAADAFRVPFLVGPAALAALLFHLKNTVVEVVWAFSIFLEAVAIMPQLFLLQKTGEVENITSHYIAALGAYRALYAVNWLWRAFWEPGYRQWLAWTAGIVQTVLYADFFYHYIKRYVGGPFRSGRGGGARDGRLWMGGVERGWGVGNAARKRGWRPSGVRRLQFRGLQAVGWRWGGRRQQLVASARLLRLRRGCRGRHLAILLGIRGRFCAGWFGVAARQPPYHGEHHATLLSPDAASAGGRLASWAGLCTLLSPKLCTVCLCTRLTVLPFVRLVSPPSALP